MVESDQKCFLFIVIFNFGIILSASRANRTAAHNSKRAKETTFNGATFDFATQLGMVIA